MTTQPCSLLALPKHFGRRPDASFPSPSDALQRGFVLAAKLQHQVALAVRDALDERGLALDWLAGEVGEHVDHLRRKLHGKAQAGLADLTSWIELLSLPLALLTPRTDGAAV
jgi:hypothetical protein